MSLYANKIKVNGIRCGMIRRGADNGGYVLTFEREFAALEQIEEIPWGAVEVTYGSDVTSQRLPEGYGFELSDIRYLHNTRCYEVSIRTASQYLGDVTEYQEQVEALENTVSTLGEQREALQAAADALTSEKAALTEQNAVLEEKAAMLAELEAAYDEQ